MVSSILNFTVNRTVVFRAHKGSLVKQIFGYYILVLIIMALGSLGVQLCTDWLMWNEYIAKLVVDTLLSVVSFLGQRLLVFQPVKKKA